MQSVSPGRATATTRVPLEYSSSAQNDQLKEAVDRDDVWEACWFADEPAGQEGRVGVWGLVSLLALVNTLVIPVSLL